MKRLVVAFAVLGTITSSAFGDVLASYTFDGSARTSFDSDSNSAASAFSDGPGWVSMIDTTQGNSSPSIAVASDQTDGSTQGAAVTANDYYTFTLTPAGGFALNLTSLTFDYASYSNTTTFPNE